MKHTRKLDICLASAVLACKNAAAARMHEHLKRAVPWAATVLQSAQAASEILKNAHAVLLALHNSIAEDCAHPA